MANCVGRERELAFITSRLESTGANGTGLVLVAGPAGIGKSTLLGELRERSRLAGFAVVEGFCVRHSAFAPWATVAAQALAFLRARGEHEQLAPGDVDALAPLISGRAPKEREEDDEGALHFAGALSRLLAAVGRVRPVLVLLRGFSQVDESSRALLRTMLDSAGPAGEPTPGAPAALIVAAVRSEEVSEISEHPRSSVVTLDGLDLDGVRKLVNDELFLQRMLAATGGAPDAILGQLDRPATSRAAEANSRVAQLGVIQRTLLAALHAAGRPLPVHVLASAAGVDATTAARAVPGLVDARMIWRNLDATVGDVVLGLELRDDGIAANALLSDEERRALEQRLGEVFIEWGKVAPEEWLAHLLRGRSARGASNRATDIAQTLLRRHAPATAMRVVLEAAHEADEPMLAKLAPIAAQAARGAGMHPEARALVERARGHEPNNPMLSRIAAELALAVGDLDACESALERARATVEGHSDDERSAIAAVSAEYCFQRGALSDAERFAHEALSKSREEAAVHTQARNTLTKVYLWRGELDRAWDWVQEHIARARTRGATTEVLRGVINLGVIAVRRGDLDDAARHFEAARSIAARGGTLMMRGVLKENEAVLAHLRGRFGDALALYQEALGILIRVGHRQFLARVANNLGELYVQVGETSRARRLCDYAAQVGRGLARGLVAEGLLLRGQIDLADGHVDAARSALQEALSMFASTGEFARGSEAHLLLARAALTEGDTARAQQALDVIPDDEERSGLRVIAERAQVSCDLARSEGRDSQELAERALELAERTGDADLELRAHVLCGLSALDRSDIERARSHAADAERRKSELLARVGEALRVSYDATLAKAGLQRLAARLDIAAAESRALKVPAPNERPTLSAAERSGLVGESAVMNSLRRLIARVGPADTTVLLRGETGTGKERVAEAIHRASRRRSGPMVKVNCAAIGEGVLLSELFGHERGAYTGAHGRRKGRFEAADGGTIFLDEIGDISPAMQSALLRVLQEHTFERVGGNTPIRVDVRVIAATNKNLEEAMRAGAFREDLYYRLADITVRIAPLRERIEDVPLLATHFVELEAQQSGLEHKRLSAAALRRLCEYPWPGNVRELYSKIRNALVMSEGEEIQADDIELPFFEPRALERSSSPSLAPPAVGDRSEVDVVYERIRGGGVPLFEMRKELEKGCIQRALAEAGGNITRAATLLGMKRPRLSQLVREYGLAKGTDPSDTSES